MDIRQLTKQMVRIAAAFALLWPIACLPAEEITEHEVKAAMAHKITKFVTWPDGSFAHPQAPIRFCVVDVGPIRIALEAMQGVPVHGREVHIETIDDPVQVPNRCHVLYLSKAGTENPSEWLQAVADAPILTIGETAENGGEHSIVTLSRRRNRVRFDLNPQASRRAGLSIAAQLLQLEQMQRRRR